MLLLLPQLQSVRQNPLFLISPISRGRSSHGHFLGLHVSRYVLMVANDIRRDRTFVESGTIRLEQDSRAASNSRNKRTLARVPHTRASVRLPEGAAAARPRAF